MNNTTTIFKDKLFKKLSNKNILSTNKIHTSCLLCDTEIVIDINNLKHIDNNKKTVYKTVCCINCNKNNNKNNNNITEQDIKKAYFKITNLLLINENIISENVL